MRKGFTLIELLIVVIVLGILATIAVPQFGKIAEKARRAEADSNIAALETAQHMYYAEKNEYATKVKDLTEVTIVNNYWATTTGRTASSEVFYVLAVRTGSGSEKGGTYWKTSNGGYGGNYTFLPAGTNSAAAEPSMAK